MTPILIVVVPFIIFTFFFNWMYILIPSLNDVWDYLEIKTKNSQDVFETIHYFNMKFIFHIIVPMIFYSLIYVNMSVVMKWL